MAVDERIERAVHHMYYDPMENGINMINVNEKMRKMGIRHLSEMNKIYNEAKDLIECPQGNPYQQLLKYKKILPKLVKRLESDMEDYDLLLRELERLKAVKYENANKRWDKEDDEMLIDMICNNVPIYNISTTFGRSPSAISTRVSYLVGINRLSQDIAGKFIGTINGEEINGDIKGVLEKK